MPESFAQQGEDLILASVFHRLGIERPTYLDIGAADPARISNTYLLYLSGSRGVLVEPNPAHYHRLASMRPGDTVLNVGVGAADQTEADYYLITGPNGSDLNTFSREMAESYEAKTDGRFKLGGVIKVPLVSVNRLIAERFASRPDLVCVDAEGFDLAILGSLDFDRYRPPVFCVETLVFGTKDVDAEILALMHSKGYVIRGGTWVNTIFVDGQLLTRKG